jgi:hypothetical protein
VTIAAIADAAEAGAPWSAARRDFVAKLLLMLSTGDNEALNAARMLAREDLHGLAAFVREAEAPGSSASFAAACRPFLVQAVAEVRSGAWSLSGTEPGTLRALVAGLEGGGMLDAHGVGLLWRLLGAVRRRVRG